MSKFIEVTAGTKVLINTEVIACVEPSKDYLDGSCLLYTSPSPRDRQKSRMPSSA